MYPNSLPYALALLATSVLSGGLALYALGRRGERPGVGTFGGLLIALSWYSGAAALELLAPELEGKVFAAKLKLTGLGALGPLWLAFALRYTRRAHWLTWPNRLLIALPSLFGIVLAVTNDSHYLVWTGYRLDPESPALIFEGFGVGYGLFLAAQYMFILAAAVVYAQAYAQSAHVYRQQIGLMLAGALVPLLGNLVYLWGVYPVPGLDLTPFSFALSAVFLATGLFRLGLLDVQPIAARVIFNHLRDAAVVLDNEGRVLDFNRAARDIFQLGDDSIGLPAPAVLRNAPPGGEVQIGAEEPRRWFRIEFSPLRDVYQRPLGRVAVARDVTHELQLNRLQNDLTHMLIHDLSNPLSAMQMALEMVQFTEGPEDMLLATTDAREAVEIVRRSNARAQRLVADLLDISRLESGAMPLEQEHIRPVDVAHAVLRDLQPLAEERRLTLHLQAAPDLPAVIADSDLLDRILRNLLGNAIKFTPPGGQVHLSIATESPAVRFTVRDTGPGLPGPVKARLFQKFVRGAGPQRGHGLGLAFCKLAVETMGGRIWAESEPGQGAAFHFTLKSTRPAALVSDAAA